MEKKNEINQQSEFYRFQVFQGKRNPQGKIEKTKSVGMAYHQKGEERYILRLWTFPDARFYLLPDHKVGGRYFVMTREENKKTNSKNKYFWNIVGSGRVDSAFGVIEIELDLFEKKIFMNIFPEVKVQAMGMSDPDLQEAA